MIEVQGSLKPLKTSIILLIYWFHPLNKFRGFHQRSFIKIHTGNDPITGKFARGDNIRGIEKGYASYIGIYGDDEELVSSIADFIRKHGDSKDESPHASDFI